MVINRFKIGADPEFQFYDRDQRAPVYPQALGMRAGLAFGADNNGRLVEIRPRASTYCVEVVASILDTLRWLAELRPDCLGWEWLAAPYIQEGLGGHVHFGRLRKDKRDLEIDALEMIRPEIDGLFKKEDLSRRAQAQGGYGRARDIREQIHGYEYRTFATWLDSPQLAIVALTLAKLAVADPEKIIGLKEKKLSIAEEYAKRDEDAELVLRMFKKSGGPPGYWGRDFKPRWGIKPTTKGKRVDLLLPPSIGPDKQSIEEIVRLLVDGTAIPWRVPELSWVAEIPKDYISMIQETDTYHMPGVGELLWDVCRHKDLAVKISGSDILGVDLAISNQLASMLTKGWEKRIAGLTHQVSGSGMGIIFGPQARRANKHRTTHSVLREGLFPLWGIEQIQEGVYEKWRQENVGRVDKRGTLLYGAEIPVVRDRSRAPSRRPMIEVDAPTQPSPIWWASTPEFIPQASGVDAQARELLQRAARQQQAAVDRFSLQHRITPTTQGER